MVQAGSVRDVHFHHAAHRPPVPRQLPPPAPHFTSRGDELARLDALLGADGPTLTVLIGPGGVGKTALALNWAHRVQDRFADGQLHVDLGGFTDGEPLDPGEALGMFLRALGVPPEGIPATLREQTALYRSITATRSLLILLDNAYSAAQVRVLLPAAGRSTVLATSRNRLGGLVPDGARLIDMAPLGTQDAITLLTRVVGPERIARERGRAEELAAACDGLPLALCVAAARLAARPRLTVAKVAAELADEATRLEGLSLPGGLSVRAAFDVSYRHLDPAAAMLYRRLALHPGNEFSVELVGSLTPPGAGAAAELLLQASLLQESDDEHFSFHDLVRAHARRRAEQDDGAAERETAVILMLEWYLAAARRADEIVTPYRRRPAYAARSEPVSLPRIDDRSAALRWLERERGSLVAAGRTALELGHAELAWQLSDVLWPLLLFIKPPLRERLELHRRGLAAALAWGDAWAEAVMLKRLGHVLLRLGDLPGAESRTRAAIQRYTDAGDPRGRLDAEEELAAVLLESGRPEEAVQTLTEVLAGNRRLGAPRNIGLALIGLGIMMVRLGRPAEALEPFREAEAGLRTIDPYNSVRATMGLAGAQLATEDLPAAQRNAEAAERRTHALGAPHEQAEALVLLARITGRRGDPAAARRHYRAAFDLFTAMDSPRAAAVRGELDGVM